MTRFLIPAVFPVTSPVPAARAARPHAGHAGMPQGASSPSAMAVLSEGTVTHVELAKQRRQA